MRLPKASIHFPVPNLIATSNGLVVEGFQESFHRDPLIVRGNPNDQGPLGHYMGVLLGFGFRKDFSHNKPSKTKSPPYANPSDWDLGADGSNTMDGDGRYVRGNDYPGSSMNQPKQFYKESYQCLRGMEGDGELTKNVCLGADRGQNTREGRDALPVLGGFDNPLLSILGFLSSQKLMLTQECLLRTLMI